MDPEVRVSTESWHWWRKFSCCSCRDLNPWPFSHKWAKVVSFVKNLHPHNLLNWFLYSCLDNSLLVYKVCSWTDSFLYIRGTGSLFLNQSRVSKDLFWKWCEVMYMTIFFQISYILFKLHCSGGGSWPPLGLPVWCLWSSLHPLTPFPPVPVPNKQPCFCGC